MSSSTGYEPNEGDPTKKDHFGIIPTELKTDPPETALKSEEVSKEKLQASQPAAGSMDNPTELSFGR